MESETTDLAEPLSTTAALPTCHVGDTLSKRYRLDEEIGRGGMGVVFRGWDLDLERAVAVKVMAADLEAVEAGDRLIREARAAAALSHPHVVAVHVVGRHEGMPYFVMELVDGPSLRDRPPVSLEEIIALAGQICDALAHAHQHGLVHRDLKPANVLLEGRAGAPSVKIVDLGLAVRERGVRVTRQGGISGTVTYMAPEQALGQEVDGRTDLYALGVMLYEFTTGRLPFDGDNALAVLSQHLHAPVVPPRTYRADLPENIEATILRLLAKNPSDRFAAAADAAAALSLSPDAAPVAPVGASTALGEQHENPGVASIGFEFLMENALWRGRWREGLAYADQHGVLAEKASSSDRLAWNYLGRTFVSLGQGELAQAEAFSREGLELADRLGDERLAVFLGSWQAQAVADAGRLEEATDLADRWIERADVLALKTGQIESRRVRAHIAQLAGDHAATLEYADQAEEILDGTDESIHPVWIHGIVCQALVATGRLDEAETRLRATLEATRKALMPHWEGVAFKVRGLLNRARELFEKCGALGDLAKLS